MRIEQLVARSTQMSRCCPLSYHVKMINRLPQGRQHSAVPLHRHHSIQMNTSAHKTAYNNVKAFSGGQSQLSLLLNVGDVMTTRENIITCTPDTPIDDALELIVQHEITGLPVVDPVTNTVVGIVSDFDLLVLEGVSDDEKQGGLFPQAGDDWNSFFTVQKYVEKNKGKVVGDIMTTEPVCVRVETSLSSAAHVLLHKKIRRLPVIDGDGQLVGIITRSTIIKAAWESRK